MKSSRRWALVAIVASVAALVANILGMVPRHAWPDHWFFQREIWTP